MTAVSDHSYVSSDGDVLDEIVNSHYGDTANGRVEAVLAANPKLASLGPVLPAGVRIKLPAAAEPEPQGIVNLWD